MEPVFQKDFQITSSCVDRFDRLKLSQLLDYLQQVAGDHCVLLGADRAALTPKNLFWAVIRHRVQITRLPRTSETITVKTWPMPTTRTAFPRSTIAFDADNRELFRSVSLWVLMDMEQRTMILPGKSDIVVDGFLQGNELAVPGSMVPKVLANSDCRLVRFTDLDWNGHMNNCRYLDWVSDILPSSFHQNHFPKEFSVCYLSEAREGESLKLHWELTEDAFLAVDAVRENSDVSTGHGRVFSARVLF